MLPFSLTDGWTVMGDSKGLTFEAAWGNDHVVSRVTVNGDEIIIDPVAGGDGPKLVVRLDVFELLVGRAIILAHTQPGADRG